MGFVNERRSWRMDFFEVTTEEEEEEELRRRGGRERRGRKMGESLESLEKSR